MILSLIGQHYFPHVHSIGSQRDVKVFIFFLNDNINLSSTDYF